MHDEPRTLEVLCTVRVSHTHEDLSAHVELDGDIAIAPGDRVVVHGDPIAPPWGEVRVERRRATVTRATALERLWLRLRGHLECTSLIELHFSEERAL